MKGVNSKMSRYRVHTVLKASQTYKLQEINIKGHATDPMCAYNENRSIEKLPVPYT
jgi:hypothetical protein